MTMKVVATGIPLSGKLTVCGFRASHSGRPQRQLLVQMFSPLNRPTVQAHLAPGQGTMR